MKGREYHMPSKFKRQCNWTCDIKKNKKNEEKKKLKMDTKERRKKEILI